MPRGTTKRETQTKRKNMRRVTVLHDLHRRRMLGGGDDRKNDQFYRVGMYYLEAHRQDGELIKAINTVMPRVDGGIGAAAIHDLMLRKISLAGKARIFREKVGPALVDFIDCIVLKDLSVEETAQSILGSSGKIQIEQTRFALRLALKNLAPWVMM
ncbi:MAG: hypothetical protein EKK40_08060 [Bradyrhizobiaceae bacterium]|nr:MAG: hypothetical protein EKK40_08060 [Bradyrhizobiaceae bacterium]